MRDLPPPPAARELIARLPRTFGPALNEQLKSWELLFPAEQRQIEAQLGWLSQLPAADFKQLFARVVEIESKMELPRWDAHSMGMSVEDVGLLARSPLYPQWRTEVERVFAKIDDGVASSGVVRPRRRVVVCVLPAGLPIGNDPLWPDLGKNGAWSPLKDRFNEMLLPLAAALARRTLAPDLDAMEATWIFECDTRLSPLSETTGATVLSWNSMAALRREFLKRLNSISRDLKSVDRTNEELRRVDISRMLSPRLGESARLREFVRSLLLSGNGSLVFSNSFVQWGASEAFRRAQPQVLIASFGIRPKLKPFSSTVLFEDQARRNPVPEQDDPEGSFVDALMLAKYVHYSAQRINAYETRTLTLMTGCDLSRVLILGARAPTAPMSTEELTSLTLDWLAEASNASG
jgi:hypothetical protein